ncbi:hypothetical protein PF008_g17644 [Phytophthora fragariae]|uniref:DDE Tnp4 domain-containing protein n=1 Tax=Phytophthora fragariae TaxID=53985 RepID=A0A6G0R8U5_9STRA|nr:hypothetical protein PF008_g17644 [Phytophthora fragariae]
MDDITAVILGVVIGASVSAAVVAADKRGTGWFHKKLRCDKNSFLRIYELVHAAWEHEPGPNCKHQVIKRVALTVLYLAQGGTMDQAASALGVSRSRAVVYINETLDVVGAMANRFVVMSTGEELTFVGDGFFVTACFPDTIGAIDGTLVRIARPHDFEGWYCRKNYPAVNGQAVVDHRGLFRTISIRSGSNNDQSLWNGSGIRKRLSSLVPPGKHLVADAGYKIWGHILTPFPESEAIGDRRKRLYNYVNSKTRIVVECAFGRLKNRFRILLGKLEQKSAGNVCKTLFYEKLKG